MFDQTYQADKPEQAVNGELWILSMLVFRDGEKIHRT